jgi:hypothetical protein
VSASIIILLLKRDLIWHSENYFYSSQICLFSGLSNLVTSCDRHTDNMCDVRDMIISVLKNTVI